MNVHSCARALSLGVVITLGALVGCSAERPFFWASQTPAELRAPDQWPLATGDKIVVWVRGQPTFSGEFVIGEDGSYVQPFAGSIPVAGLTTQQAAAAITTRLVGLVENPAVTVAVFSRRPAVVSVVGEVQEPGQFEARHDEGLLDALARAKGLTQFADPDRIFLLRKHGDQRVRIRFRYGDLAGNDAGSINFTLRHGDIVVVE